ncbi:MAG: TetR/AcrR family transcriptional regulator [Thermomicrobiales bacterium]
MVTDVQPLTGKALLLSVARALFLKDGYNGVSIQQIAEAAHMTKGSPYYHFKNKEDLFTQVFVREVHRTLGGFAATIAIPGTLEERVFRCFQFVLIRGNDGFSRINDDFDRYIAPHLDPEITSVGGITVDSVREIFLPIIDDAIAEGVPFRFSRDLASRFMFMVIMGHSELSSAERSLQTPAELVDSYASELTSFVLHGLITTPDG